MSRGTAGSSDATRMYAAAAELAHQVGEHRFHRSPTSALEASFDQLTTEVCALVEQHAAGDVRQMLEGYIDIAAAHDDSGRACRICACGAPVATTGTGLEADLDDDLAEARDIETFSWDISSRQRRHPSAGRPTVPRRR